MPQPPKVVKTIDRLIDYLIINPEVTARRMAADLGIDKTSLNSILYANGNTFLYLGDRPPLWSVRPTVEVAHTPNPYQSSVAIPKPVNEDNAFVSSFNEPPAGDNSEKAFDELREDVEYLVRSFPGIRIEELQFMLDIPRESLISRIRDVQYLVTTEEGPSAEYSDSDLKRLEEIAEAAVYAFPLSTEDYDDLVRRGFVKGVSSMRIIQIFGSWRAACDLAGVEAPAPPRRSYERRWTERELAESVARYLSEPEFRGAHHRYDEWRKLKLNTDEIPSSGTLKNYLGRSWITVRNRGLEVLREQWHLP